MDYAVSSYNNLSTLLKRLEFIYSSLASIRLMISSFVRGCSQIHHIDAEIFGTVALPNKDNSLAIGGKDWIGIDEIIVGKLSLVFTVCVHHDDFGVAVSIGVENDLRTIGRECGVRVNRWIIGQFYEVASVAVNDANFGWKRRGGHLQHRLQRQCVLRRARMRDRGYRSGFGLIAFDSRRLRP